MSWIDWAKETAEGIAHTLQETKRKAERQSKTVQNKVEQAIESIAPTLDNAADVVGGIARAVGAEASAVYRGGRRLLQAGAKRAEKGLDTDWTLVGGLIAVAVIAVAVAIFVKD